MSLPSFICFYGIEGDQCNAFLAKEFINCGWVYDEIRVMKDIITAGQKYPWRRAVAYGVEYYHDTIEMELAHEEALQENRRREWRKRSEQSRIKFTFPVFTKPAPMILADHIIDVQPMKAPDAVYTMKTLKARTPDDIAKELTSVQPIDNKVGKLFEHAFDVLVKETLAP